MLNYRTEVETLWFLNGNMYQKSKTTDIYLTLWTVILSAILLGYDKNLTKNFAIYAHLNHSSGSSTVQLGPQIPTSLLDTKGNM